MSTIRVNIRGIRNANGNIPSVVSKVDRSQKVIRGLQQRIANEITAKRSIGQRLEAAQRECEALGRQIQQLYEITAQCAAQYEAAEHSNSRNAEMFE